MQHRPESRRWMHRGCITGGATAILIGTLGMCHAAYAGSSPASQLGRTPTAVTHQTAFDTELNAHSNTYLDSVVQARAETRAEALATIDKQADEYARELAAAAELQAALLNMKTQAVGGFVAPLASYVRTSHFGETSPLWESSHTGEDFAAPLGTPLVAIGEGVVTDVGDAGAYGLRTIITLADNTEIWYCHQTTAVVNAGDTVKTGQPIGAVGATGNTTGPHLHLEVRPSAGAPIDPVAWLNALGVSA